MTLLDSLPGIQNRSRQLSNQMELDNHIRIDRLFAGLMVLQWITGIVVVFCVSPYTWIGSKSLIHAHVWAATLVGGAISIAPVLLGVFFPGRTITRHVVAIAQASWGALLIHLTGGRIETHFHIFVSLAFIAYYRDWKVLVTMSTFVAIDHALRGIYFPLSVYGIVLESPYRWIEHAAWVGFEDIVLISACLRSKAETQMICDNRAELEVTNEHIERTVKQRSAELVEAQDFLQSVFDSIDVHICVLDSAGRIVQANALWNQYPAADNREEISIGKNYIDFCRRLESQDSAEDNSLAEAIKRTIQSRIPEQIENHQLNHRDRTSWYQVNITPLPSHCRGSVVVAHCDISSQIEANRRLFETKEHLELLSLVAKYTDNAVAITDANGQIEWVNAGFNRITGYSFDEVQGKVPIDLLQGPQTAPDQIAMVKQKFIDQQGFNLEICKYRKTGEMYWSAIEFRPIHDEQGLVVKFVGIESDITEKRKQELEKKNLSTQLQDAARMAGKAEVATGILHNVGNVLNSVNVSANLLKERLNAAPIQYLTKIAKTVDEHQSDLARFFTDGEGKQLPGFLEQLAARFEKEKTAQHEELDHLVGNIEHIKEIVEMQQSFARKSAVSELLEPVTLFEDAVKLHQESLVRHGVEVVRQFEPIPTASIQRHDVIQILLNLIKNAQQALSTSNNQPAGAIYLTLTKNEDHIEFQVDDDGPGIAQEDLEKIFQHGFTTKQNGHGFGLHSSANKATELGGSLTVSNQGFGKGASFKLRLPMQTATNENSLLKQDVK